MIEEIAISNVATYGTSPEVMSGLKEINFIYGANGAGKTTISRVIRDCASHPGCSLTWQSSSSMEILVYNRDFVEKNFNQSGGLKGIFTLGEKDKALLDKINEAKSDLDGIKKKILELKLLLGTADNKSGKRAELIEAEAAFEEKCWSIKTKLDDKLQGAFVGVRGKKKDFRSRLLHEAESNSSAIVALSDLESRAASVFADTPQEANCLAVPNVDNLLSHENNPILRKRVLGKADVDIAALINTLGNSDWVKQGREHYCSNQGICPFCQQLMPPSLEKSLGDYFDDEFSRDTAMIKALDADYRVDADQLQQSIQALLENTSEFLDSEKLRLENDLLASRLRINIKRIEEKIIEPSKSIELDSLASSLDAIKSLVEQANVKINSHNTMVRNLSDERDRLKGQVWRYILDHEIEEDLKGFTRRKAGIEKAIENLERQIEEKSKDQQRKEQEIKALEMNYTSIQPTIDAINDLLSSFGFTGFSVEKSEEDLFYKINRLDGSDAMETLSEGEKTFISFLYFYYLLKGSESETGTISDRIVVIDDPVSSMDSDILFIVSNLIKGIFDEAKKGNRTIKQVFVLTHNVYFHKEVSFSTERSPRMKLKQETFWTVKKIKHQSKIRFHESNPIKTSYELLWSEIRNHGRDSDNLTIQNTMRRILENYFKIFGNIKYDDIYKTFEGADRKICRSLVSWINDGSHLAPDALYVSIDDSAVEGYLSVFKRIFVATNHAAHYNMMMGEDASQADVNPAESSSIAS